MGVGLCPGVTPLERVDPSHSLTDTAPWRPNKVARAPDNMLTGDNLEGGKEQRENPVYLSKGTLKSRPSPEVRRAWPLAHR